jgi:hypothetical protein
VAVRSLTLHVDRLVRLVMTTTGLTEVFHVAPTAGEADLT